jgi:hypothetical protein
MDRRFSELEENSEEQWRDTLGMSKLDLHGHQTKAANREATKSKAKKSNLVEGMGKDEEGIHHWLHDKIEQTVAMAIGGYDDGSKGRSAGPCRSVPEPCRAVPDCAACGVRHNVSR